MMLEWEYWGNNKKYFGHVFKCPINTNVFDDAEKTTESGDTVAGRTFFLDKVEDDKIHGHYFDRDSQKNPIKVNVIRNTKNVRPCDNFINNESDTDPGSETVEDPSPSSASSASASTSASEQVHDVVPRSTQDRSDRRVHCSPDPSASASTSASEQVHDVVPRSTQDRSDRRVHCSPDPVSGPVEDPIPGTDTSVPSSGTFTSTSEQVGDVVPCPTQDESDVSDPETTTPISRQVPISTGKRRYSSRLLNRLKDRPVSKKQKRTTNPKPNEGGYQQGMYAADDGGLTAYYEKPGQKPLSKNDESHLKKRHRGTGEGVIYMVRAWKIDRNRWVYEGKRYNSSTPEPLTAQWLNQFNMKKNWRKRTILKNPERGSFWYRVPVSNNLKSIPGGCVPISLIKFFNYIGQTNIAKRLTRQVHNCCSYGTCLNFMYTLGSFKKADVSEPVKVDPVKNVNRYNLYLLQICSIDTSYGYVDNTHAICIFDNQIFDANHDTSLDLNEANLNECCLGGDSWVFKHVSRGKEFTPKKNGYVAKWILKRFFKKYSIV